MLSDVRVETLHPMWGLSGFGSFLLTLSLQSHFNVMCCFFVSLLSLFFPCSPLPRSSILSRTGRKESQEASNLAVPMTMCLFPVPFPLTPSLRPQVSSINPTVTRSLLYSVLRDAPADRGGAAQQSRDAQLSEYPSLDYQGLYATLVTLLDLVPLLQHGQHGE